jgi:hypothetical protein
MRSLSVIQSFVSFLGIFLFSSCINSNNNISENGNSATEMLPHPLHVEYLSVGDGNNTAIEIPVFQVLTSENARVITYRNDTYQVVIHEIDRGNYTEINGEMEHLSESPSCATLRIGIPYNGDKWQWYQGLDGSDPMESGKIYSDTVSVRTILPPDGAFNGKTLADGGYGDAVGQGTMSFYPLCAISIDGVGKGLGLDMSVPVVYRLCANTKQGLIAEFDLATSPSTIKFPNRAFFKMAVFDYNSEWGMRAALQEYYSIFPEQFKKRVVNEGTWLPFTSLRSITGWEDFGFAFHEISWGSSDRKDGKRLPSILSDKETGVLSFQYTEPWDIQLPIESKSLAYKTLVSDKMISKRHREYLKISATEDKNGLWQTRRLETPWFRAGWAVSITTNSDPDLVGFNRYQYILKDEINPAIKLNVDGIYFDSMEWNWHHDLNYREEHFASTDYPLTFSKDVARPAIWNFTSEFEFMKKIADEMHSQGKLVMGNGHGWNPFAASNLDLFGSELSWYSSDAHNTESLDFRRAISFQKPIVFLLNEGLNDKAFTEAPYPGYGVYFEKMLAYGFFPSFFSVDASSDPYWRDSTKVENGRPFFKKYIPIIKQVAGAGWEPLTLATCNSKAIRIERFGHSEKLFFTIRNRGSENTSCSLLFDTDELGISKGFKATEIVDGQELEFSGDRLSITVPAGRTYVVKFTNHSSQSGN